VASECIKKHWAASRLVAAVGAAETNQSFRHVPFRCYLPSCQKTSTLVVDTLLL
jgi:hypothetical protein